MRLTIAGLGAEADLWIPVAGMPLLGRRSQASSALTQGRPLTGAVKVGTVHGGGVKVGLISRGRRGRAGSRKRLRRCLAVPPLMDSMDSIHSAIHSLIAPICG